MIRIFMTGDNHIGLRYASHEKATVLVAKRIEAFESMVLTANREECELFVITGDLFENTYGINKRDVNVLLDMLSRFNGTVIVLPGNHDYYDKDSNLWRYFEEIMQTKDNIMLLKEYKPYSLDVNYEKVIFYPALCTSRHSEPGVNNLGWIKDENIVADDCYKIGIAHGAVEGETIDNEGRYFIMKRSELNSIPVDVWLIGHTHVPFPANLTEEYTECEKILNAGTHVQTDVSCNTEGECFIIEIDNNKKVRAKKVVSGNIRFYRKSITLSAGQMSEILERELNMIGDVSCVEINLSGAVANEEYENRRAIIENKLSRFIEGKYHDDDLSKLISEELIDAEFPETSFSAKLLKKLISESDGAKEAQLAYELMNELR